MQQFSTRRNITIGFAIFFLVICFFAWYTFAQKETSANTPARILVIAGAIFLFYFLYQFRKMIQRENSKASHERKLIELKSLVEQTNDVFSRVSDAFVALDDKWNFTYANAKAGEIFGLVPGYFIGKNIWSVFSRYKGLEFHHAAEKAFQAQQPFTLQEFDRELKIWFQINIYPSPTGLSIYFRDITYKRTAELALKESEEKYRAIVDNYYSLINTVDGIVWEADAQTFQFAFVSKQAERLLGYPVEKWINEGSFWKDHIHPDDQGWAVEFCLRSVHDKKSHEFEYRMIAADGSIVWIHDIVAIIVENDKAVKLRGIMVDVTARKKSEQSLRATEETTRLIMDSALDAIICMNTEGRVIIWSSQAEKIFGWKEDQVIGKNLADLIIPVQYRERHNKGLEHYLQTGEGPALNRIIEISALDNNGREFPVELSIIPVNHNSTVFFCGFMRDITKRKKAEEELAQSYESIRKLTDYLQKIREEERSNIAREIHDELGQQLTVLKMDISWLNKKIGADDEPSKQKFQSLTEVLDGTVKTVRRISSELRPSLLDDLGLTAAMEWHLKEFEQNSGIKTEFNEANHNVDLPDAIKTGLFRVFQESLTNVARHADAGKVKVSLQRNNGNIVLSIIDNGQGFDKQNTSNKSAFGILGMQERTTMMGGSYEIKSVPGQGTTVVVSVPENIE